MPVNRIDSSKLSTVLDRVATQADGSIAIQPKAISRTKWSFHKVLPTADTSVWDTLETGSGQTVAQVAGDLVLTTGTTSYAETILRSKTTVKGPFNLRWKSTMSQRIVDQNFVIELVDKVGDNLAFTVDSATSITVNQGDIVFEDTDIGKGVWIGNLSLAGCLTQRAVIASTTATTVTLTVAAFPASGDGTCNLFGYNFFSVIYSGATVTALGTGFTTQRNGWTEAPTTTTIATTTTGHIGIIESPRTNEASFMDQVFASGAGLQATSRSTRNQNVPDDDTPLYLQIRMFNNAVAPLTTTTWTIGFVYYEEFNPMYATLCGVTPMSSKNVLPVTVLGAPTTAVTTTLTSAAPTIYADTTTNLAGAATYTGSSRDAASTNVYRKFTAVFVSDKASATDGAKVQHSVDGTNWYDIAVGTLVPNIPMTFSVDVMARYHRVLLINAADATTKLMIRSSYQRI